MLAADAAAHRAGLRVGMPATKAQALVLGLIVKDAEPTADAEALDRLALWALQRYSPMVAADPPDGLVIDATGAAHLHGGETAMIEEMVARLAASGIAGRAPAIAGARLAFGRFVARPPRAAARRKRYRSPRSADRGARYRSSLPIAALRLPLDMVASLRVLGFERIASSPRSRARRSRSASGLWSAAGSTRPWGISPSRSIRSALRT